MEGGTTLLNSREWNFPKELPTQTLQLFLSIQAGPGRNPDWVWVWVWGGGVWGQRHRKVSQPKRSTVFNYTISEGSPLYSLNETGEKP